MRVKVLGAGLAGSEAAYQLLKRGIAVQLYEMRPIRQTPAHKTGYFAELVCSNSLKSIELRSASGILKEELKLLDSLVLQAAYETRVPAGKALAVDREEFSRRITERLMQFKNLEIIREEVRRISLDCPTILATGPLTTEELWNELSNLIEPTSLYFFDAIAPIVRVDSIDFNKAFVASRYDAGTDEEGDYINCPMTEEEYQRFYEALIKAEVADVHDFEKKYLFPRCQPIEEIARSGYQSMRYGPLRPVGIIDPRTGRRPFAVVQLRYENRARTLANIVGFQTRLKWPEQERVLRMIPGLEKVELVRYGEMHINKYVDAPRVLNVFMQVKGVKNLFLAGQITGVEGYLESAASGLYVGMNVARWLKGEDMVALPAQFSVMGALFDYITSEEASPLKPTYANYALVHREHMNASREQTAAENLLKFKEWVKDYGIL